MVYHLPVSLPFMHEEKQLVIPDVKRLEIPDIVLLMMVTAIVSCIPNNILWIPLGDTRFLWFSRAGYSFI